MKKIILIAIGSLLIAGCDNGTSPGVGGGTGGGTGGGEYPYAEYFPKKTISPSVSERPHIKIYFNKKIVNSYIWKSETTFSITIGGVLQSFGYQIELVPPLFNTVGIWFDNDLPTGGIIKVSYDGIGVLTGKLEAFSNLTVSQK
jgi:hypothetical protein